MANVVQEIQRGRTFGRRRQQEPKCSNGIRSRGVEEQIHLRREKKTAKSIGGPRRRYQLRLENMANGDKIFRKTMGIELVKRANWTFSGVHRMMDRTLWRCRPPLKRKNKLQLDRNPVM
jgi:hypothetical protein